MVVVMRGFWEGNRRSSRIVVVVEGKKSLRTTTNRLEHRGGPGIAAETTTNRLELARGSSNAFCR
jgi:hypothetical protein